MNWPDSVVGASGQSFFPVKTLWYFSNIKLNIMRKLAIACFTVCLLAFATIFLTSSKPGPAAGTPTLKKTAGGFGSNLNVYEYKSSEGYTYIIVQGNGDTGPVSVFR
jgi:hypothetical protein